MKQLIWMLPSVIALASCAPTATVETPTTDRRVYAATCAQVLDAVAIAAPSIRPASLGGVGGWQAFQASGRTPSTLVTQARSTTLGTGTATTITWMCSEADGTATVTASSTGQRSDYAQASLTAFWQIIKP